MMSCEIDPRILRYIEQIERGEVAACREQIALAAHVRSCFEREDIYTDAAQLDNYLKLTRYFPYEQLFPWEEFLLALWDCTYRRKTGRPRWKTVFCMIGRGAGKDGFIAFDSACMLSPYNPVPHYDVDICANNEDQAMRPPKDFMEVLETPQWEKKLDQFYYHTKELVQGRKNKGVMTGHTNNPKGRDGLRSGKVIFNEVHQYENYDNIKVFITGMGKVPMPRVGFFTSNGEVSDGPLDDYLERSKRILFEGEPDKGFLPFVCRLDDVKEVHDRTAWAKANPSLPYSPHLMEETEDEYIDWCEHPEQNGDFVTKRMGIRSGLKEISVTAYENITRTNRPLPDLRGWSCTVGIDYAELSDWAAVNLHFRRGEWRFDINHAWICTNSRDIKRLKVPWRDWAKRGDLTVVDDVSISPVLLAKYIVRAGRIYNIKMLAMDNFRWTLVADAMRSIGFDAGNRQRVKLIRPSDIMQVAPVVTDCFDRDLFTWGDVPHLRWAVNNTKRVRSSSRMGVDTGNFIYAKIEPKSRKTDPFMALVASMCVESALGNGLPPQLPDVPVIVI